MVTLAEGAVTRSCCCGRVAALELLLADPRVTAALSDDFFSRLLSMTAQARQLTVMRRLLELPSVAAAVAHQRAEAALAAASRLEPARESFEVRSVQTVLHRRLSVAASSASPKQSPSGPPRADLQELQQALYDAAALGDVATLQAVLSDERVDSQLPMHLAARSLSGSHLQSETAGADRSSCSFYAPDCALTLAASVAQAAGDADASALKELLADPCWEHRQVTIALLRACEVGYIAAVEQLLDDPRVELSPLHTLHDHRTTSAYSLAASSGSAAIMQLLLAEARRHGFGKAAVARHVAEGVRALVMKEHSLGSGQLLSVPAVLHAVVEAHPTAATAPPTPTPTRATIPAAVRNAIDVSVITSKAWARRRAVVAARARALEED